MYRWMYICDFSRSVGAGSATTRNTRGLTRSTIRLIVPPLPAVSRPSNTTQTLAPDDFTHSCMATSSACRTLIWRSYSLRFIFGGGPAPASCRATADDAWASASCCFCLSFFFFLPMPATSDGCSDVTRRCYRPIYLGTDRCSTAMLFRDAIPGPAARLSGSRRHPRPYACRTPSASGRRRPDVAAVATITVRDRLGRPGGCRVSLHESASRPEHRRQCNLCRRRPA